MHLKLVLTGGLATAAVLAAACGAGNPYAASPSAAPSDSSSGYPSVSPVAESPTASPSAQANGTTIAVSSTRLGRILAGPSGRTVYIFLADRGTTSSCNSAACVQYWPPVLTAGAPSAGAGANPALLGTTQRKDGTAQVTYAGHPLYYFITDKKAGDVTGQGINGFGGPWYVVSPSGRQIQ